MPWFKASSNVLLVTNAVDERVYKESLQSELAGSGSVSFVPTSQLQSNPSANGHATAFSYDGVLSISFEPHNEKTLVELCKKLKPGSSLVLREPILLSSSDINKAKLRTEKELFLVLTVSGFVDAKKNASYKPQREEMEQLITRLCERSDYSRQFLEQNLSLVEFSANKPDWQIGASEAIRLPLSKKTKIEDKKIETKKPVVWTLAADDVAEADLEDEDTLLGDEDLIKPMTNKKDDCDVGKGGQRKACKNCSCGRKELEESSPQNKPQENVKSSCGNCYLGDAFRCSSCPHLGTPAFKPGEKVQLDLDAMDV